MCRLRWIRETQRGDPSSPYIAQAHGKWTPDEDETLLRLVSEAGLAVSWVKIAKSLPGRDANHCRGHWIHVLDPSIKKGTWAVEEDRLLVQLFEQFGKSWMKTIKGIPGRNSKQCCQRWRKNLDSSIARGTSTSIEEEVQTELHDPSSPETMPARTTWTRAEDKTLIRLVRDAGSTVDWAQLANCMPGRREGDCRERLESHLNPAAKNLLTTEEDRHLEHRQTCDWSLDEDMALTSMHALYGNSWELIAEHMPGRSHLQCRRRWLDVVDPSLYADSWTSDEDE